MYIFIFILKLIEFLLYKELASGYPAINISIFNFDCILASLYSILIFIIIYFYLKNEPRDKNKLMYLLIILIIFTIILIWLLIFTLTYSFPVNLRVSRGIGLLLSIITCIFVVYKGNFLKH